MKKTFIYRIFGQSEGEFLAAVLHQLLEASPLLKILPHEPSLVTFAETTELEHVLGAIVAKVSGKRNLMHSEPV